MDYSNTEGEDFMKILLTGGSGILGQEIQKLIDVYAPSHDMLDITDPTTIWLPHFDLIIHAAAYTNVNMAEVEKAKCFETNVIGTRNLASTGIPMLYISTDSVFDGNEGNYKESDIPNPINYYSKTKLLGEQAIWNGTIIRCCPKTYPWAHDVACTDRFFSAEYVHETAKKIVRAVEIFYKLPRIVHIGSKRQSHYEFAKRTKPNVKPIEIQYYEVHRGRDISLDCALWDSLQ